MKKDWMIKESELDDDQIKVLTAALDKSCIVSGCAGSGKSVLALIKAQRIQKERGNDYQIIVYTKTLSRYMNSGRSLLGLTNEFHHHWYWVNCLNAPKSDYIIVDEIQDFEKDEIKQFLTSTKKNFFFFGDTAQSIFEGLKDTIRVEDIRIDLPIARDAKEFQLYRNYRLPLPVAHFVQNIGIDLGPFIESTYKSEETEMPRVLKFESKDKQLEAIHRIITTNNLTDVAILLPEKTMIKQAYASLTKLGGNYEVKYAGESGWKDTLNFNSSNPKIMTYHSAKGLQFETVFVPYLEDFKPNPISRQKSLYVAMTRTYRNLYIMYSGHILPYPLLKISPSLYKNTEVDTIDDI